MTLRTGGMCIILVHTVWLRQYRRGTDGLLRTRYAGYIFGSIGKIVTVYGVRGPTARQYVRGGEDVLRTRRGASHWPEQYTHFQRFSPAAHGLKPGTTRRSG